MLPKIITSTFLYKSLQPFYCGGGGKVDTGAAERARLEEQRRLEAMKAAEEARVLKETLANKTQQAEKEATDSAARAKFQQNAGKTALEDLDTQKKKSLLSNYSG